MLMPSLWQHNALESISAPRSLNRSFLNVFHIDWSAETIFSGALISIFLVHVCCGAAVYVFLFKVWLRLAVCSCALAGVTAWQLTAKYESLLYVPRLNEEVWCQSDHGAWRFCSRKSGDAWRLAHKDKHLLSCSSLVFPPGHARRPSKLSVTTKFDLTVIVKY